MKKEKSSVEFLSNLIITVIILFLLTFFCFGVYNQHQTNKRVIDILDYFNSSACLGSESINNTQCGDASDASGSTATTATGLETAPDNLSTYTSFKSISAVEYSSAIAFLSKIQEVSSINNSSSLLALVYTIISSLILTYGARMLRLGEDDKEKLVKELSEQSRQDISDIEKQMKINSLLSNIVVSICSATSLLQLLLFNLPNGEQDKLETINASYMDSLSTIKTLLKTAHDDICRNQIYKIDLSSLAYALILFEQNFEIYKEKKLPDYINDKKVACTIVDTIKTLYTEIANVQVSP